MAKNPAFQMYAADFKMDTDDWEAVEVGVYIRLLLSQWVNGSLPKEKKRLARIGGVSVDVLVEVWLTIGCKFVENETNCYNEKMETYRAEKETFIARQVEKGLKSAEKRKKDKFGSIPVDSLVATKLQPIEEEEEIEEEVLKRKKENKQKGKPSVKILFSECEFYDLNKFIEAYAGTDYEHYNLHYYYECVKTWSAQGNTKSDWIATARGFMLRDFKENKAVLKNGQANSNNRSGQRTSQTDAYAADLARRIRENESNG